MLYLGSVEHEPGQTWRSMTERFRYPPKGYSKHNTSVHQESPPNDGTSVVCSASVINTATLTSSVSQKIHMDRMQGEKNSEHITQKPAAVSRPRSGRFSGII